MRKNHVDSRKALHQKIPKFSKSNNSGHCYHIFGKEYRSPKHKANPPRILEYSTRLDACDLSPMLENGELIIDRR